MKLFVNETEITLFDGATVTDALRAYGNNALSDVLHNKTDVINEHGHVVGVDGALHEGASLFLRTRQACTGDGHLSV